MTAIEFTQADPKEKVLLIGDLLIDRTYYVEVTKLSPEAPVPVAMLTGKPIDTPGGAGLAAAYAAVHSIPLIFGTYTSIETALWINNTYKIPVVYSSVRKSEINAIKTRYIDNERFYHLLRVDSDRTVPLPFEFDKQEEEEWFRQIKDVIFNEKISIISLLDYKKGFFNKERCRRLISIAKKMNIPVYVDSRSKDLKKFTGASVLKLNTLEFGEACELYHVNDPYQLIKELDITFLIKTKGSKGAEMWSKGKGHCSYTPDLNEHEGSPDVTGCGDVFDVTFCHEWSIKKIAFGKALETAVETATKFAYESIGERLKCQS